MCDLNSSSFTCLGKDHKIKIINSLHNVNFWREIKMLSENVDRKKYDPLYTWLGKKIGNSKKQTIIFKLIILS